MGRPLTIHSSRCRVAARLNSGVRWLMKLLHTLAISFFLAAIFFYVASSTTGAWILTGLGITLEAIAWVIALTSKAQPAPDNNHQ